jgi:dipeptidyl aminopeptidase/acylaminoacyl peptidase
MSKQAFTVEDLFLFRLVRDLHVSPDGRDVAIELKEIDRELDDSRSAVWLIRLADGHLTRMTGSGDCRMPRWSPDGRSIAFISDREGSSQPYVLARDGGEARQVAHFESPPSNLVWSPDGTRLVVTATVEIDRPKDGDRSSSRWKNRPKVVTRLRHKSDGAGFVLHSFSQMFVVDVASGKAQQVTEGDSDVGGPGWSPDGKHLVFCRARSGPRDSHLTDVWIARADGSDARQLTQDVPSAMTPCWSPDGRWIVFAGASDAGNSMMRLWRIDLRGHEVAPLGDESIEVASFPLARSTPPVWSADSARVAFLSARRGTVGVDTVSVPEGRVESVVTGDRFVTSLHASSDVIAFVNVAEDDPGDVHAVRWDGSEERRLSHLNAWWDARTAPRVERRSFAMPDGEQVEGWLLRPSESHESPGPLLVDVHGGPHSLADFAFPYHVNWYVLCSHGWSVLALNARGSSSYGEAFAKPLRGHWGELDLPQHLAAVDALQAEGIADGRVAVAGKSYGGFLAAWAIGHTDRFRAAVVSAPVANIESHFGTSDSGAYVGPYDMGGEIDAKREIFRRNSPVQYAHRATTPTLILQGEEDARCPIGQSEELFTTLLRVSKAPAEMVLYPSGHHDLAEDGRPSHREDYHRRIVEWVTRWCTKNERR